ncbi:MAG: hypothetical protein OXH50_10725 [Gemmatimonadetes bacterium]|nr:hypothetical protein [Gemmatimonadota bacterium]
MGDRVSPVVEFIKTLLPVLVCLTDSVDLPPKVKPESVEVRTEVARGRVAFVELSMKQKLSAQHDLKRSWLDDLQQVVDALGV